MAKKEVTVYSKPSCVQCTATKRWLGQNGYPEGEFVDGDAIENLDHLKTLLNVAQAPVIKVVDKSTGETIFWTGHNPIMLEKHLKEAV